MKVYEPRTNLVRDKNDNLLADCHNILKRFNNYFSQLLNIHKISDVMQMKVHTAQSSLSQPGHFEA
jgi:hypothetical protein